MTNRIKKTVFAAALCAAVAVCAVSAASSIFEKPVYDTGEPVAGRPAVFTDFRELKGAHPVSDLSFLGIDGKRHKFSDYRGNLLVVDMWATWCSPCVRAIPLIVRLQKTLAGDKTAKVKFVSLSIDRDPGDVTDFLKERELEGYDTWLDPDKSILSVIPADVVPTAFFFDGRGNLVGLLRGFVDWSNTEVEDFLRRMSEKYADPTDVLPNAKSSVLVR